MTENTTARYWLVQLPDGLELERKYQWPVTVSRVLAEHRSALAAWPVEFANDTPQRVRGSSPATGRMGIADLDLRQFSSIEN